MVRRDAARTERSVPVAVEEEEDALILGMFPVLEIVSAAVRTPSPPVSYVIYSRPRVSPLSS
jgi:hypothetical protein